MHVGRGTLIMSYGFTRRSSRWSNWRIACGKLGGSDDITIPHLSYRIVLYWVYPSAAGNVLCRFSASSPSPVIFLLRGVHGDRRY